MLLYNTDNITNSVEKPSSQFNIWFNTCDLISNIAGYLYENNYRPSSEQMIWLMIETEVFLDLDKILLNNTNNILEPIDELLNKYYHQYHRPLNKQTFAKYLAKYIKKTKYHPSLEQKNDLWHIAGACESPDLIDILLKLQNGKCSSNNLIRLLNAQYYSDLTYIFELISKFPNSYKYEPDNHTYELLEIIIDKFSWLKQREEILRYFLDTLSPFPTFQKDLNQLIYKALIASLSTEGINILIELGANPFSNYYENDIDTSVPIIFKAMKHNPYRIKPLLKYKRKLKNWNITDEWGRNLLHYVTDRQEIYEKLLKNGVDPDHRALIDNEAKVVIAKMKGTLPKEYGKTPRELIEF